MSESMEELRAHWDAFAGHFDETIAPTTLLMARILIAQLGLSDARALLEVGAGGGRAALVCRAALPPGARHSVTDLSPATVAIARARLPAGVDVRACDAAALPYEDDAFDRVLMNLVLMLVPEPGAVLAEVSRVLGPGGRIALSVWGRPEHSPMFTIPTHAADRLGMPTSGQTGDKFALGRRDVLADLVRSHGFERIRTWYQLQPAPFRDGATYAESMLGNPRMAAFLDRLSATRRAAFIATLGELADEILDSGQPIALELLVLVAERSTAA